MFGAARSVQQQQGRRLRVGWRAEHVFEAEVRGHHSLALAAAAGRVNRRQHAFDLPALAFEPRRQHQRLAQVRRILVGREPRTVGRDLEQHAAWFLEVHRLEPEAIDDAGRVSAGALHLRPHRQLMRVVVHAPGEVVHRADAPSAAALVRRFANVHVPGRSAEPVARPLALAADALEAQRLGEEARGAGPRPAPIGARHTNRESADRGTRSCRPTV